MARGTRRELWRGTAVTGLSLVRVRGRSMTPTLRDGDLLLVARVGVDRRPRLGDLVVVDLPAGRPRAVKRLVAVQDGGWWVERDNPAEGVDSWSLGAVPAAGLQAFVLLRLWPRPRVFRRRLRSRS